MKSVQEHAQDFLIEMGIQDLPVPVGKLRWIARKLGYDVRTYSEAMPIIESLNLSGFLSQNSFAHWDPIQQHGTIYVDDRLQADELRYALAHELGHIMLHFSGRSGRAVQLPNDPETRKQLEEEADEFARAILAPASVLLDLGATMPDEIEEITGVPHSESYKVYDDINRYRNKLADKIYQDKRDEATAHNFRRLIRKHEANPYRWVVRISSILIVVLSGIIMWMLTTNYVLPSIAQANATPQQRLMSSDVLSAPESSTLESSAVSEESISSGQAISEPTQPPSTAVSAAPKEPARSGGETKTQDRVIYYQAPAQQAPTPQAPVVQEAPQETEPTYTLPPESSKSEPVYSQPPKVIQDDGHTYYWTAGGSVYHSSPDCYHIRDKAQASGILQDALDAGKKRLCYDCPKK